MDHCTGTRVFMVHFLVEFSKWTWTDGCIYMPQDSRAVQTAAKASSSMTTEGSLHETKFLTSSSEDSIFTFLKASGGESMHGTSY